MRLKFKPMRTQRILKKRIKQLSDYYFRISGKTYYNNREKPIVFIFGTGRSGSKAIISTLNNHSQILGFHEQLSPLIRLTTELAGSPGNKEILQEVKAVWDYQIYPAHSGELVVHSDQRFWNLIPFLKDYFPQAKYLLLVREPVGCIKSFVSRNIFQDNEYPNYNTHAWAKYRLSGPISGEIKEEEWANMTAIERAAWYWCYINSYVKSDFDKFLSREDYMILETEELGNKLSELQAFLTIPKEDISLKITNKRRKKDDAKFNNLKDETVRKALRKIEKLKPEFLNLHTRQ